LAVSKKIETVEARATAAIDTAVTISRNWMQNSVRLSIGQLIGGVGSIAMFDDPACGGEVFEAQVEIVGFAGIGELAEEGVVAMRSLLFESIQNPVLDLVSDGFGHEIKGEEK
jgi:hypothetical protein